MIDEDLRARKAKAQAAIAEIEAKRAKREEAGAEAREVERLERKAKDDAAIADAEEKLGELGLKFAAVETDLGVVIVKRPNPMVFKRWQDLGADRMVKSVEVEKLVRTCLVYPAAESFERLCEELPATPARLASAIVDLANGRAKEVSGK